MERGISRGASRGALFATCILTLTLAACGKKEDEGKSSGFACKRANLVSEDQMGSFTDRVGSSLGLELGVPRSASSGLSSAVDRGAAEWNRVAAFSGTPDAFRVATVEDRDIQTECESIAGAGVGTGKVRVSLVDLNETTRARAGLAENLLAVTVRCVRVEDREVQGQVLFFRTREIPQSQLPSVVVHELGHTLGLDHSCTTGQGSSNYRACQGLSPSHPYSLAVMFPTLQIASARSNAQIKEALQQNDVDRFQCLY